MLPRPSLPLWALLIVTGWCSTPAAQPDTHEPRTSCLDRYVDHTESGDLPSPVRRTREVLLRAAREGDWTALDSLSREEPTFRFSFGDPDMSPVEYWRQFGAARFLDGLAFVLSTEPAGDGGSFTWPDWFVHDEPSPDDLAAARCALGVNVATELDSHGRYIGLRTAIRADGVWLYAIGGD